MKTQILIVWPAALAGTVSHHPSFFARAEFNPVFGFHPLPGRAVGAAVNLRREATFNYPLELFLFHSHVTFRDRD
jgi:hypothetical protein